MNHIIVTIILAVTLLAAPAHANGSILDPHVQNLTSAGADYVSGKITHDELLCKVIETEYLMRIDKEILDLLASRGASEINSIYEVSTDEQDKKYEKLTVSHDDSEMINKVKVLSTVLDYKQAPDKIVVYYNLEGDKPVAIYLAIIEDYVRLEDIYKTKFFYVEIYPSPRERTTYPYFRGTNPYYGLDEKCLKNYIKPKALKALENAIQAVESAKESGIDTSAAEGYIQSAKNNFESGNYGASQEDAYWALILAEKLKALSEFRSLSDNEKIRFFQEHGPNISREKNNISRELSEEDKTLAELGLNKQFNLFVVSESNSLSSFTEIIDINNRTITRYENQLIGDYDFYVGIDAALFYELGLMGDARSSLFSFGKRIGIGILKGEIKIKPFWKFYRILSLINNAEFSRGVSSGVG